MRITISALLVVVLLACLPLSTNAGAIVLRHDAAWMERAAAADLQRVIYTATGKLLPIDPARRAGGEVIAVGFSPVGGVDLSAKHLGEQGFTLKTLTNRNSITLVAAGANPVSTCYAVYTLAERYGAGFYLGGDALPTKRTAFAIPKLDIVQKPVLKVRGVLPWYNFFDSPTAWNIEDYRSFIDQLAKSKNNFLGFHSYDHEPFCAYRDASGKMVYGAPLVSTAQPTWGTAPMTTSEFAPVARPYFEKPYFGADCSMGYKTPEEGIANAQKLLAQALWYAKARGVKTCVGFEVTGDPTAPGAMDALERRLKFVLKTYPMLDYVWVWETEALGLHGTETHPARTDFGAYYRRWDSAFSYVTDPRRRSEAVRIGIYALAAHRILKREAPGVKMILSAWGGDNHLRFTDFYPGYDKVLPKNIIFSALDNIITSDTVSAAYGKLSKDREFWPIPWFEFDGDQWCPQPNTKHFYNAARDALKKGASGMLAIHWRTRDVEEAHAYMSQFAWNPNLGYEQFYDEYAGKAYGDKRAAGLLMDLQNMGYRWVGGGGQSECGGFTWNVARENGAAQLRAEFEKYAYLPQSDRFDGLQCMAKWLESYDLTAQRLRSDGSLKSLLSKIRTENRPATREEKSQIEQELAGARRDFSDAIDAAAHRVANRGELGILATINAKAWSNLLDVEKAAQELGGITVVDDARAPGPLAVRSILPAYTGFAGQPFRISAIAYGASPASKAEVLYRRVGQAFNSAPLRFVSAGRLEGCIPPSPQGLVEYYVRVSDGQASAMWPAKGPESPACVSIVPAASAASKKPVAAQTAKVSSIARATCSVGAMLVRISWPEMPQSRAFRLSRSVNGAKWGSVGTVRDNWYEDRNVVIGSNYRYRIIDADSGKAVAESRVTYVGKPPLPAAPKLSVYPGPGRVRLCWSADDVDCSDYHVYQNTSSDGSFVLADSTRAQTDPRGLSTCVCPAAPGVRAIYVVRGVSFDGREGPPSPIVSAVAFEPGSKPIVSLNFDGTDSIAAGNRTVEDGVPCARTGSEPCVQLPHQPEFNTYGEIAVQFWVKLNSAGISPVFVSHGMWTLDGMFVQYFNSQIRFCLAGVGCLDAGGLQIGKWTAITATYDGAEMAIYINGVKVGSQPAAGYIEPATRPLYIGRYEIESKEFPVDGWMGGVRMFQYAVSPEAAQAHYQEMLHHLSASK